MVPRPDTPLRAALYATAAVTLAYQVPLDARLPLGVSPIAARLFHGTYGAEGQARWTSGRATVTLPEPGPGRMLRLELELDGWRPAGQTAPSVSLRAGGEALAARVSRPETLALVTRTSGVWSSDLELALEAETFRPAGGDTRELGVRLRGVSVRDDGPWRPRRPPLGPLCWSALAAAVLASLLARLGARRAQTSAAAALVATLAFGYGWQRFFTALAVPYAFRALAAAWLVGALWPAGARRWWDAAADVRGALGAGLRRLGAARLAFATLAALALLAAAERSATLMELDLGSGQEAAVEQGLGPYDADGGVTFREARRGARLDLTALGSGRYALTLRAAAREPRAGAVVAEANGVAVVADALDTGWHELRAELDVETGASGPALDFGADAQAIGLRLDGLRLERSGGRPNLGRLAGLVGVGLVAALVVSGSGASSAWSLALAGAFWLGLAAAARLAPLTTLPMAPVLLCVAFLGALVWAAYATAVRALRVESEIGPGVIAAASLGFMGWLAALLWPEYRGGHFGFHSQIAEEIWRGRFLVYYLPYPGSMLSRQAQWGNVIVPHPCLYHTLVAPLAALPPPWFHRAEKVVLALLLCALAVVAGRIATRLAGARAGTLAAACFCLLVPTYQLLGLGHLMTLLGVWAGALALAFVGRRAPGLHERPTFWAAVALLVLAFLSYTATLLFTGVIVTALAALHWRDERRVASGLATALAVAGFVAFGVYYVNWTIPFLSESIPGWLHGVHEAVAGAAVQTRDHADRLQRLLAEPGKLTYSYGHLALPFVALAGLVRLPTSRERTLLLLWLGVLFAFSVLADPFFNLLLKHHYFAAVPVAVGLALWGALPLRAWWQRGAWWLLVLLCVALGAREAIAVATGGTP